MSDLSPRAREHLGAADGPDLPPEPHHPNPNSPVHRPKVEDYSIEVARPLLETIATSTYGIQEIAAAPGMPSMHTIHRWAATQPDFHAALKIARQAQADLVMKDAARIADEVDTDHDKWGSARVAKARLQVDVRHKWAKRLSPDWHERMQHALEGPKGEEAPKVQINATVESTTNILQILKEVDVL